MSRKNQTLFSFIATLFMVGVMQFQGKPLKDLGAHIVQFELAKTPLNAEKMMHIWGESGISTAQWNTYIDFIFIAAYASLGYFCSLLLTEKSPNPFILGLGRTMAFSMVLAGLFDIIENLFMLKTLENTILNLYTEGAYWFAVFKFGIIGIVILTAILIFLIQKWRLSFPK